ncbi:hypothetical protein D0867_15273 [Hortaea werneckii]|uniref:Rho GDP-dissociation inhibitor n=1 Tax=Hortaea werneckii TaxID=91943 RepID=A0A3M6XIM5_HORWE|nr:hypothetical protein D0867_15273 [Hortaea werneckii]
MYCFQNAFNGRIPARTGTAATSKPAPSVSKMSGSGAAAPHAEDLEPEQTEGFKVGEKKTLEEYQQLDQNDESLRKWKESLGLGSGNTLPADPSDKRTVIILSLGLEVDGRPDIVIDLTKPGSLEDLNKHPFTIKEGATFRMKARFRVQHGILSGLKYVQVVSRMGVKSKMQEMIGSYSPNTTDKPEYEKKCKSL